MKTTLLTVLLIFTLTIGSYSQMESNITNRQQEQVVQLYDPDNDELMFIQPGGSLPLNLVLAGNGLFIPLKQSMIYNINRIRIVVYLFMDEDGTGIAYPKWEQFSMNLSLDAAIVDANFNPIGKSLFENMRADITDGITSDLIFNEPFIFKTSSSSARWLRLIVDPTGSVFTSLSGIVLPPPAGLVGVTIKGRISLEGVYYGINLGGGDETRYEEKASEAGLDVNNAIDIEI